MFSFFQSEKKLSRFESCLEFQPLLPILTRLRNKEIELRESTSKHTIVSYLLTELDKSIDHFNKTEPNSNHYDEMADLLELTEDLQHAISQVMERNIDELSVPRNSNKEMANLCVTMGPGITLGMAVMAGLITGPLGMLAVAGGFLGGVVLSSATGLTNPTPDTVQILGEFEKMLNRIHESLLSISENYSHTAKT